MAGPGLEPGEPENESSMLTFTSSRDTRGVGFEPTEPFDPPVFKTGAIGHSAIHAKLLLLTQRDVLHEDRSHHLVEIHEDRHMLPVTSER